MDKLAEQLQADAALIDVQVSDELDRRIAASLRGISPQTQKPAAVRARPATFWWASSLTGIAATFVIIAVLNPRSSPERHSPLPTDIPPASMMAAPAIDWQVESAMLTNPLRQELLALQSDVRKAEQRVKEDIGL